jgi:amidophosphoribosyltransferase
MSEEIKHECGIALLRLKKPIAYYKQKYGSALYGLEKLYLLMEKQHNRGQDGSGVAVLKNDAIPGQPFVYRQRSIEKNSIQHIFDEIHKQIINSSFIDSKDKVTQIIENISEAPFIGNTYLGHLRYGTYGNAGIEFCHPFIRQSNFKLQTLVMAGNFNLTNNDLLIKRLIELGQHPRNTSDTITVLEQVGYRLDEDVNRLKRENPNVLGRELFDKIANEINFQNILKLSAEEFDGGFAIAGFNGSGYSFLLRDPNGIRPAYYYEDDEVIVITSERPPIKTAFNIDYNEIKEVPPGSALIIDPESNLTIVNVIPPKQKLSCSFERIYFSRGTDRDIYIERKKLGQYITPKILKSLEFDLINTVFSYIPNTAEVAFLGMMEAINDYLNIHKLNQIKNKSLTDNQLTEILSIKPRMEKIAVKDAKLRTFITADDERGDLVNHVYDTTYGIVNNYMDNLVILDDSIVRGTTLKNSILRILDRLKPKKIIIVSSAPQIRYPDCYGIDMSKLNDFIVFKAAIELLKEQGNESVINEVYQLCKNTQDLGQTNFVKKIYDQFSTLEISVKIGQLLKTEQINAEVEIIYQEVEDLHKACPEHLGDWYFTGNYPTLGGNRVANISFINFIEGSNKRAY